MDNKELQSEATMAKARKSSCHVDKVTISVEGIPGIKLAVHSFELTVAVNMIPRICLEVLPIDSPKNSQASSTTASASSFADLTDLYNRLSRLSVDTNTTATISIDVKSEDSREAEVDQSVKLKDWILSDVGLSSVSSFMAPTLTAVFSHPIIKLDRSGAVYEAVNTSDLTDVLGSTDGDNIVDYMDNLYDIFAEGDGEKVDYYPIAKPIDGGPTDRVRGIVENFRKELTEYKPGRYLKCEVPLFLSHLVPAGDGDSADLYFQLKAAIGSIIHPSEFGDTTWMRVIGALCPKCIMQVVPTYHENKLSLEPYNTWDDRNVLLIPSNNIISIDMVSTDPDPIIGVALDKSKIDGDKVVDGENRDPEDEDPDSDTPVGVSRFSFYIPEGVSKDNANGRLEMLPENTIISIMKSLSFGREFSYDPGTGGPSIDGGSNTLTDYMYEELNETCAKAMFNSIYRKQCTASIAATLLFRDESGNMIYPGRVLTTYDHDTRTRVFYGYMSRMTLRGSVDGNCTSYYELMTARPAAQGCSLVPEGTKNPCYKY